MIIDTHTHLYVEQFDTDLEEVLHRAQQQGVEKFVLPSIDKSYGQRLKNLLQHQSNSFYGMIGLHPTSVHPDSIKKEMEYVINELEKQEYIAVGEIGVDLYWDKTYRDLQMDVFGQQIDLARKYNLPFAIHCRDSFPEIFEVVEKHHFAGLSGVLHCFSGTLADAKRCVELGLKLGIGGVVTFKNGKINTFLNEIPLENIVLETDAPYLAPAPNRGKRNEPSYLNLVIDKLAEVYDCDEQIIVDKTTANAKALFNIA